MFDKLPKFLLLFFILCGTAGSNVYSEHGTTGTEFELLTSLKKAANDSLRIELLSSLSFYYNDHLGDSKRADSVSMISIGIAEESRRPELMFMACSKYLESNDLNQNFQKALGYAVQAEQITWSGKTVNQEFQANRNLAMVYLAGYQFEKALLHSYRLLSIAGNTENKNQAVESYLLIGQCLEGMNQMIDAFRNYLNAVAIAERTNNPKLKIACYTRLAGFYNVTKLYNKSVQYKILQQSLVKQEKPVDSTAFMWIEYDLQVTDIKSGNQLSQGTMQQILGFSRRHSHQRLLSYELALIRTHFIETDKISDLQQLYYNRFPEEFDALRQGNPSLFYRLKAIFCEKSQKNDSALYYFSRAEEFARVEPNIILRANFYNRYGQFLIRQHRKQEAASNFLKSLTLAKEANYMEYMSGAARELELIYAATGEFQKAYTYSVLGKSINDSVSNMSKKDQLLAMEIDHETRERQIAAEQEEENTTRRYNLQYSGMIVGILTVFIILIMLGSFRVHEWIIKTLGFFSFIFLFEFIILLADHQIHELTHGEPWKIMIIKIFLIAILLPLHHGIEKRVISYLLHHRLIDLSRFSVRKGFWERFNQIKRRVNSADGHHESNS